jgi:hypothetical protein
MSNEELSDPFADPIETAPVVAKTLQKASNTIRKGESEAQALVPPIVLTDIDVTNFMGVQRATVKIPELGLCTIGGKNNNGKSSFLMGAKVLIGGKSYVPETPVHIGEGFGSLVGTIKDGSGQVYTITRQVKKDRSCDAVVTRLDGSPVDRSQEFLNALAGPNWRNPLAFMDADEDVLAKMVKEWLGLDLTELDRNEKVLFEGRTLIGRERDRLRGLAEKLPFYEGATTEEKTPTELTEEWNAAVAHNTEVAAKSEKLRQANVRLAELKSAPNSIRQIADDEVGRLEAENVSIVAQIKALQNKMEANKESITAISSKCVADCTDADAAVTAFEAKIKMATEQYGDLTPKPTEDIAKRMTEAEEENAKVRANNARRQAFDDYKAKDAEYDEETVKIEDIRSERKRQIATAMNKAAKVLPELHFDDDGNRLMWGELPFKVAAESDRIRAAIIMSFTHGAGSLKLCLVDGGEAMDEDSLALLDEIGKELGVQILLVRVSKEDAPECRYIISKGVAITPKKKEVAK